MSTIKPSNPDCLTDKDVNHSRFSCCGDEDLVFLKCRSCSHIWVECFECSTWFVDLKQTGLRESALLTNDDHRNACPACETSFEDLHYLADDICHKYLPTLPEIVNAGLTRFLSDGKKAEIPKLVQSSRKNAGAKPGRQASSPGGWLPFLCGTLGAMGWIIGVALTMFSEGDYTEGVVALVCSLGVALVGSWLWLKSKRRIVTIWMALIALLAASFACGLAACIFASQTGALESAIDPDGKYPAWVNFGAPIILALMIGILVFVPAVRKRLQSFHI